MNQCCCALYCNRNALFQVFGLIFVIFSHTSVAIINRSGDRSTTFATKTRHMCHLHMYLLIAAAYLFIFLYHIFLLYFVVVFFQDTSIYSFQHLKSQEKTKYWPGLKFGLLRKVRRHLQDFFFDIIEFYRALMPKVLNVM